MKAAIYCHSIAPSIDGVCRRFTGLLKELSEQGHDLMLFTLEDAPEDLPPKLTNWVTLEHMCVPSYPDKKVAKPTVASMMKIYRALRDYKPDVRTTFNDSKILERNEFLEGITAITIQAYIMLLRSISKTR
jgi:hypothetical protein